LAPFENIEIIGYWEYFRTGAGDPTCPDYDNNPFLRAHFTKTRADGMKVKDKWKETNKNPVKVKITGVPFWDGVHTGNVTGASQSFREIHPIIKIEIQ
jgi:hypothetical protein